MNAMKKILVLVLATAAALASGAALAHGGVRFSVGIGIPLWGPGYYPGYYYPPYYAPYYPPAYYNYEPSPPQPQRYVEQAPQASPAAPAAQASGSWFYCAESKTYYPYVKECPAGWQRVSPTPPQ